MRGAFKNSRSFLFSFFSLLLEWCQVTKAPRASLNGCSARDQPARGGPQRCEGSMLSQPPGTPHLVSQMECALKCDPSLLRPQSRISVLSGQFRPSSPVKQAHASLKARWHKTIHSTKRTWNQWLCSRSDTSKWWGIIPGCVHSCLLCL